MPAARRRPSDIVVVTEGAISSAATVTEDAIRAVKPTVSVLPVDSHQDGTFQSGHT